MKHARLVASLALLGTLGAGSWLGCGGDDSTAKTTDAGVKDASVDQSSVDASTNDIATIDAAIGNDCASYCAAMGLICAGDNAQYLDPSTCLAMCAKLPAGAPGATSGDTLACRVTHAKLASASSGAAATHCPHAGPYGFGACGAECDDFCKRYLDLCGAAYGANCPAICAAYGHSDGGVLDPNPSPTLTCREYHLENAYANAGGGGHCSHAGPDGGGICN